MKRAGNLISEICTFDNALSAYRKARECKRYRPEVLEFEHNREENLLRAIDDIYNGTYIPGKYEVFKVHEPKERLVMALPFYDRVIQHMIVNVIELIFDRQFIYHSYACRKDKGAHAASDQLTRWLYNFEVLEGKRIYVLKCDIHHYFQSVDHVTLKKQLARRIKDKDLLMILDRVIDHNGIFPDGMGIPVGNLTSQLFANVYLHEMDMFAKHTLKAKQYIRYMDDFGLLSDDINQLRAWQTEIDCFAREELLLTLNPKTTIVCAKNGVDFVGYRHWNSTKKIRKRAMRNMRKLIRAFEEGIITEEFFDRSFSSRIGYMEHADTYNLRMQYLEQVKEIKKARKKNGLAVNSNKSVHDK